MARFHSFSSSSSIPLCVCVCVCAHNTSSLLIFCCGKIHMMYSFPSELYLIVQFRGLTYVHGLCERPHLPPPECFHLTLKLRPDQTQTHSPQTQALTTTTLFYERDGSQSPVHMESYRIFFFFFFFDWLISLDLITVMAPVRISFLLKVNDNQFCAESTFCPPSHLSTDMWVPRAV